MFIIFNLVPKCQFRVKLPLCPSEELLLWIDALLLTNCFISKWTYCCYYYSPYNVPSQSILPVLNQLSSTRQIVFRKWQEGGASRVIQRQSSTLPEPNYSCEGWWCQKAWRYLQPFPTLLQGLWGCRYCWCWRVVDSTLVIGRGILYSWRCLAQCLPTSRPPRTKSKFLITASPNNCSWFHLSCWTKWVALWWYLPMTQPKSGEWGCNQILDRCWRLRGGGNKLQKLSVDIGNLSLEGGSSKCIVCSDQHLYQALIWTMIGFYLLVLLLFLLQGSSAGCN